MKRQFLLTNKVKKHLQVDADSAGLGREQKHLTGIFWIVKPVNTQKSSLTKY